jgi:hypothetical protein
MVARPRSCVISDAVVVMRCWCGFLDAGGDHRFSSSGRLAMLAAMRRASFCAAHGKGRRAIHCGFI